jgi:hypothetical protein
MTNGDSLDADELVKALLLATVPERSVDILKILQDLEYKQVQDRPALHLEATSFFGRGVVVFTGRTMQQMWLIAYLAWQTLREQIGFIVVSLIEKSAYRTAIFARNDKYISNVDRLDRALRELRIAEIGSNPWPADIPKLDPELSELRDVEDRTAYDLACFSAAFVLLHETSHAIRRAQGEDYGGIAEELASDKFAQDFLLLGCAEYAKQSGQPVAKILKKRAMGAFLGLAVTFESTELGLWLPSDSHPSVYERVNQLVRAVEPHFPDPNHDFWLFATSVLLSKARRGGKLPETLRFQTTRELFDRVLSLMHPIA